MEDSDTLVAGSGGTQMENEGIQVACLEQPQAQPLAAGSAATVIERAEAARAAAETERVFKCWGKHKFRFFGFR